MTITRSKRHPTISNRTRLISRDGRYVKIKRSGVKRITSKDLYVSTLSISWIRLAISITSLYILINLIFASLYSLQHGSIESANPGSFADAFFFSVQTFATIGYGKMSPATTYANILVAAEALTGLTCLAIATGVVFSRLSKPRARIMFSSKALISKYRKLPCLMFRLGNLRNNQIADPTVKAVMIYDEYSKEDKINRRIFYDLTLLRSNSPLLMPSWTLKHHITKESPLYKIKKDQLKEKNIEIIVSLTGFDETLSQTVHEHHSYIADEIIFGGKFVDILSWDKSGNIDVNYKKFHNISHG